MEADQLVALYEREDFQDLNAVLEGLQTLPHDGKAAVREMLSAPLAAGWMQLAGSAVTGTTSLCQWWFSVTAETKCHTPVTLGKPGGFLHRPRAYGARARRAHIMVRRLRT